MAGAEDAVDRSALDLVLCSLSDSKGEEIVTIDMTGKSALADFMVIVSGRSHRHVGAMTEHLVRDIKAGGLGTPKIEGQANADWVLIDTGDIIIHLFRPEMREFYNLEKMWSVGDGDAATVH